MTIKDKMRPTIYLDMDGVLTNFVGAVAKLFNFNGEIHSEWRALLKKNNVADAYSIEGILGITTKDLWSTIDSVGVNFWVQMDYYSWAFELHNMLETYGDVIILSSPSMSMYSWSGKVNLIQAIFGYSFRNFILCPSQLKYKLANKDSILIDDSEKNIKKFKEAGGQAILFPQPWNNGYQAPNKVRYIENCITEGETDV